MFGHMLSEYTQSMDISIENVPFRESVSAQFVLNDIRYAVREQIESGSMTETTYVLRDEMWTNRVTRSLNDSDDDNEWTERMRKEPN